MLCQVFLLAKEIYKLTRNIDWNKIEGMILLNHGVFTFHDNAMISYQKMIETVTKAENYLSNHATSKLEGLNMRKVNPLKDREAKTNCI